MGLVNTVNRSIKSIIQTLQSYYSLFGIKGVLLLAESCLLRKRIKVRCSVPGFPYPLHLRLRTTDLLLFSEILLDVQYDCDLPIRPKVIIDAGANIGLTSLFYVQKYPQVMIFAIEPEASNFEMLRENTVSYPNIIAIRAALWNKNCDLDIVDPGDGFWDFFSFRTSMPEATGTHSKRRLIRGLTLDCLMKDNGIEYIDLLKVDIEGAEKEVFESPAGWIDRVGAVAVELHDQFKDGCSDSVFAATADFDHRWKRGEITFIVRRPAGGCSADESWPPSSPQPDARQRRSRLPVKVSWAV
jgi:FkbM family methyltransferase